MAFIEAFPYYPATIVAIRDETPRTKTFSLQTLTPWPFFAGHHCVLRLTDQHGYVAARDYSLSSAPSENSIEVTVTKEPFGEVSTWLHERMNVGDTLEISKPLGDHFVWKNSFDAPLLLLAGGIGVAPLMSIVREHRRTHSKSQITLLYSARTQADLCFYDELRVHRDNERVVLFASREKPSDPTIIASRIQAQHIQPYLRPDQRVYICGPTDFVNTMEKLLYEKLHVTPEHMLTERFG